MKRFFSIGMALFVTMLTAHGQEAEKLTIKINDRLSDHIYLYDGFQDGVAEFQSNRNELRLNYNAYFQRVQFADKNDIYAYDVVGTSPLEFMTIGEDKWVPGKNKHYRVVVEKGGLILAEAITFHITNQAKDSGYGGTSSTAAISSNDALFQMNNQGHFDLRQVSTVELSAERRISYVVGLSGDFNTLNSKNLQKLFPDRKNDIKDYVKAEKIDFSKREDAIRIFEYLTEDN